MSRLILVMITGMIGPNVSWFVTGGFHWRITYNYASHWPPSHHCECLCGVTVLWVDIGPADCYCAHCVAWPSLNYCSPVVCCCKTPQNYSATIKLLWGEAVNMRCSLRHCSNFGHICFWRPEVTRSLSLHMQLLPQRLQSGAQVAEIINIDIDITSEALHYSQSVSHTESPHKWERNRKYQREL